MFDRLLPERAGTAALTLLTFASSATAQRQRRIRSSAWQQRRSGVPGQLVYDGVTIGQLEGAPVYEFATIANIEVGVDGSISVLDSPSMRPTGRNIPLYDASGNYLLAIGRAGGGPANTDGPMASSRCAMAGF